MRAGAAGWGREDGQVQALVLEGGILGLEESLLAELQAEDSFDEGVLPGTW